MIVFTETPRLLLREIELSDADGIFQLDSDPEVHLYLPDKIITSPDEGIAAINNIRKQYIDCGIGRWAVIEKSSGVFIGWAGLKWNTGPENNKTGFIDLGYRLIRKFWGNGYATEAAKASVAYGFNRMNLQEIIGVADRRNIASVKILEKVGMKYEESFYEDEILLYWYSIKKDDF